jgi:predicted ABC-type sugar transport system permease subunit
MLQCQSTNLKERLMNRRTGLFLTIVTFIVCGCPGILAGVGGILIAGFGLLADKAQLKLDTNLDQASVVLNGMGGVCLGLILVAIPVAVWLLTARHKPA